MKNAKCKMKKAVNEVIRFIEFIELKKNERE